MACKIKQLNKSRGQVMLLTVILFLAFSLTAIFGVINPVLRHARATSNIVQSKQGYFLSEAGIEDTIYRLKNAMNTASPYTLTLNNESVETTITDNVTEKIIVSTADSKDFIRKVEVKLIPGIGAAFNYGVQTGTGGFSMSNNSGVNGNVYSTGPITGSGTGPSGSFITDSAISANSAGATVETENILPATPPDQITFGNTNATQDIAQSFQVSNTGPIGKIALNIKKISTPSNITVRIVADNAGSPSNVTLSSATLSAALVTTNFGWVEVPMQSSADLLANTTYWLILDGTTNSSRYYILGANTTYPDGLAKIGQYNTTWGNTTPPLLDGYFKIYLGGLTGSIADVEVGTSGTGIAHAHTVNDIDVSGNLYCQSGSGNNKVCDTSLPDPSPLPFPISDANIEQWKNEANSGTIINGNLTLTDNSSSLGPARINGDLTIDNNYVLTVTGTIWVTGNINLSNNIIVKLDPGYGASSGTILSDGRINLSNNAVFQGSGQAGSYVLALTTSDCPNGAGCGGNPSISVSNNAGTVILNAQKGTVLFANNSGAREATANLISLSPGAVITYESGMSNVNFSSGPSGGYDISEWKEIE